LLIITKAPQYFAIYLKALINTTFIPSNGWIAVVFFAERHHTFVAPECSLNIVYFTLWIQVLSTHKAIKMDGFAHISTSLCLVGCNLEVLISILVGNPLHDAIIATIILTNYSTQPCIG
jgi:hypothetical protein